MTISWSTRIRNVRPRRRLIGAALLALAVLTACQQTGSMDVQPRYDPLEPAALFATGGSAQLPVAGTVPQTDLGPNDPAVTGLDLDGQPLTVIPVPIDQALIDRGQQRFDIYCVVCHGEDGAGDGRVVAFQFPQPPDLLSDPVRSLSDGQIFAVIENGSGDMFPYGYRVKAADRWAVIAYLRAMQMKGGHLTADLTPAELSQLEALP